MTAKPLECLICDEGIVHITINEGKRLIGESVLPRTTIKKQKWVLALKTNPIKKIRKVEIESIDDLGEVYQKTREYEIILK